MSILTQLRGLSGISSFFWTFVVFFGTSFLLLSTYADSCPPYSTYAIPQPPDSVVRKDWQSLSSSEKQRFADAYIALSESKLTPSLETFNCYYQQALLQVGGGFQPIDYLLFLKVLLKHVEDTFHIGGFSDVTIPYGNWEPAFPSPVAYEVSTLGGTSRGRDCVDFSSTPFAALDICVQRPYWNPIYSIDENKYNILLDIPSLIPFTFSLAFGLQLMINFDYAGYILSTQTPLYDPIFFLHSANLLRLFDKWQQLHPDPPSLTDGTVAYYTSQSIITTYQRGSDGVTYGPPTYDPLNQMSSGANDVFDGFSQTKSTEFWGIGTIDKRSSISKRQLSCRTSYGPLLVMPPQDPVVYLTNLLSEGPNPLRILFENIINSSRDQFSSGVLASLGVNKIYWGLSFNYTIHWAFVFESYQSSCKGFYYSGGKFPPRRGYITMKVITAALQDTNFRLFLDRAASTFRRAYQYTSSNSSTNRLNLPTSDQLNILGKDLVTKFLSVASPATPLKSSANIPSNWTCPDQWYGFGDGCDCNCGTTDPDCIVPTVVGPIRQTISVPLFGCFNGPFAQCINGLCSYTPPRGVSVPSNWTCASSSYNSGDGCDCDCGARDPDCDKVYPWNYRTFAPLLYEVKGCTAGRGATCSSSGKCQYVQQVPLDWHCTIDKYGDGSVCDCNCGSEDPDCDRADLPIEGCGCFGLTCRNKYGICEGSCFSRTASVTVYAYNTDPCSGPTPTPTPTPPSVPSKTKVEVNINFQNMLNGLRP